MLLVISTGVHVLNVWFDTTPMALKSYINSFLWRTMHILTGLKVSLCTIRTSPTALKLFMVKMKIHQFYPVRAILPLLRWAMHFVGP